MQSHIGERKLKKQAPLTLPQLFNALAPIRNVPVGPAADALLWQMKFLYSLSEEKIKSTLEQIRNEVNYWDDANKVSCRRCDRLVFWPWQDRRCGRERFPPAVTLNTLASHGGKRRSSSRTWNKMPKLKLLIFDANVVFELHELGLWQVVLGDCEIFLSKLVAEKEVRYY